MIALKKIAFLAAVCAVLWLGVSCVRFVQHASTLMSGAP